MQDKFIFQHELDNYLVLIFLKFGLTCQHFCWQPLQHNPIKSVQRRVWVEITHHEQVFCMICRLPAYIKKAHAIVLFCQGNCNLGESLGLIAALLPTVHFWPLYWFCSLIKSTDVIPCAGITQWFAFRSCNCALTPNHFIRMKLDQMADVFPHNIKVYCPIWWVSLSYKGKRHKLLTLDFDSNQKWKNFLNIQGLKWIQFIIFFLLSSQ